MLCKNQEETLLTSTIQKRQCYCTAVLYIRLKTVLEPLGIFALRKQFGKLFLAKMGEG